jgi:hypothetical protein
MACFYHVDHKAKGKSAMPDMQRISKGRAANVANQAAMNFERAG